MAQSASMGGLASAEADRSSLARSETVESLPIDREWRSLVDGGKERRQDNGWRGAQWNGVVGGCCDLFGYQFHWGVHFILLHWDVRIRLGLIGTLGN